MGDNNVTSSSSSEGPYLKLAVSDGGAVRGAVGRVHVAHGAVEVARRLLPRLARALHLADLETYFY